ncbi:outer membrane protein transport protein [Flavobacterium amniphilum]|uniref:OmpP1/FadL family transporter n=1 Tax=Flavobacterium amniphilum TaxID=1834035 RepID=UPI002029D298|nr:outer membrane protein transport protein [Flavobacterium amniphilum]MCL9805768.1 outer membrane protein transport protein [Flavobacterium amniphilum]MCL9806355.1 outer membrane protein transport protein [Flavobacterium amniphilum]
MKNYISILGLILASTAMQAQEINDALRYSQTEPLGTARFRALSGAFGAVGGDLSAINLNPASSVIFNNNQVAFTLSNYNTKNNSDYFGTRTSDSNNSLDLGQAGGVFVFENHHESDWKKFALALNYENQNNFDNSLFISGTNPTNSIDDYFLNYANGIELRTLKNFNFEELSFREQQAYLAYWAFIIDPIPLASDPTNYDNPNITQYSSAIVPGDFYHENSVETTGYNGKLAFNASANYQDKLMIGINLNSHFSDYVRNSSFFESNDNNTSTDTYVKRVYFDNSLHTYGNGFSFQLGAILKLSNQFRVGATYESPTWHRLTDELMQSVAAVSGDNTSELPADIVDPNLTMVFAPYTIQTPGKITGSAAIIFGKQGFISVDYSAKDYSSMRLKPENDYASDNNRIENLFTTSNELRIGGEYKVNQWSLRAGFRSETSPYKDEDMMGDLTGYSGGIGYNFGGTKLDLAYSTSERDYGYQMFSTGLTDRAKSTIKNNNVTVTLSFEL